MAHHFGQMVARVLIFSSSMVAHTQYIAATPVGMELGANDYLIESIILSFSRTHKYFDFGISNENRGAFLNFGLVAQKERFGGRSIVCQFYEFDL